MEKPEFAQLWDEEVDELIRLAKAVPDGGTIVEIGTAEGGSALIFDKASKETVKIYSIDVLPTKAAYKNLKDTRVKIIKGESVSVASEWQDIAGKSIDLLFIDGGHDFKNI